MAHYAHALQKFVAGDECCEMPPFLPHNWPSGSDPLNCGLDTDALADVFFSVSVSEASTFKSFS